MKRFLLFFLILVVLPVVVLAKGPAHIPTDDQECSDCHVDQSQAWMSGKHGLMNVKCVVCHDSPEAAFVAKPGVARCRGCHGEMVEQIMKKKMNAENACFTCHDRHTLVVRETPKSPFHAQGGN
jgi:hypothetical protein